MDSRARGFTLIELLVVIAIIGVLSSVVLASLSTARTKAKDAQRIASVKQIQQALELYRLANNSYPIGSYAVTPYQGNNCGYNNDWCNLETALAPYMDSLPKGDASTFTSDGRRYIYKRNSSNGDLYGLAVVLDATHAAATSDGGYYTQVYETGPLVGYCAGKFSGANANWMNWDGNNLCVGGN